MPSITIKDIDKRVLERLRSQARKKRLSLNRYVKAILAEIAGAERELRVYRDLSPLAGSWSKEEAREFAKNSRGFSKVDNAAWR